MDYNCQLWRIGMIHVRACLRHFVQEISRRKLRDGQTVHFHFYLNKLKSYFSHS